MSTLSNKIVGDFLMSSLLSFCLLTTISTSMWCCLNSSRASFKKSLVVLQRPQTLSLKNRNLILTFFVTLSFYHFSEITISHLGSGLLLTPRDIYKLNRCQPKAEDGKNNSCKPGTHDNLWLLPANC